MEKGYIVSPVNGRLMVKYDKTFWIEYLTDDHVFVKGKFGSNKDLTELIL